MGTSEDMRGGAGRAASASQEAEGTPTPGVGGDVRTSLLTRVASSTTHRGQN